MQKGYSQAVTAYHPVYVDFKSEGNAILRQKGMQAEQLFPRYIIFFINFQRF